MSSVNIGDINFKSSETTAGGKVGAGGVDGSQITFGSLTEEQKCEVFKALANVGADMSPQERQKAKEVLVAAVLVGQVIVGSSLIRRR